MVRRPLFGVGLIDPAPTKDATLATAGSVCAMAANCACSLAMAGMEMAWLASVTATITPVSCAGRKPLGMTMYSRMVPASVPTAISSTSACAAQRPCQRAAVAGGRRRNPASNARASQLGLCSGSNGRSSRPHIIGVSVSETTADTTTETARVTANSLNRRPTTPVMNSSGMNTATSETVSETMVKPICLAPR